MDQQQGRLMTGMSEWSGGSWGHRNIKGRQLRSSPIIVCAPLPGELLKRLIGDPLLRGPCHTLLVIHPGCRWHFLNRQLDSETLCRFLQMCVICRVAPANLNAQSFCVGNKAPRHVLPALASRSDGSCVPPAAAAAYPHTLGNCVGVSCQSLALSLPPQAPRDISLRHGSSFPLVAPVLGLEHAQTSITSRWVVQTTKQPERLCKISILRDHLPTDLSARTPPPFWSP